MAAAPAGGRVPARSETIGPMTAYLILHGWQNHRPEDHWQHWLADRLTEPRHQVVYPQLPDPDDAAPQVPAPHSITRPGRPSRVTEPDRAVAVMPPTATADRNRPRVRGLPPKRSAL